MFTDKNKTNSQRHENDVESAWMTVYYVNMIAALNRPTLDSIFACSS